MQPILGNDILIIVSIQKRVRRSIDYFKQNLKAEQYLWESISQWFNIFDCIETPSNLSEFFIKQFLSSTFWLKPPFS